MFYIKSITIIKFLFILLSLEDIKCSTDGTFSKHRRNRTRPGDDPCNPLYWYPQPIPEYCNKIPTPPICPIPVPIPLPLPIIPPPELPPMIMPPPGPIPFPIMPPPGPIPFPIMPLRMQLPFGIPLAPTNPMVPVAGVPLPPPPAFPMPFPPQQPLPPPYGPPYAPPVAAPYPPPYPGQYPTPYLPPYPSPYSRSGVGMVPGLPGIVSPDGGINIMPFSDAYADMLEAHKQKMVRRRMQKLLRDYERPPWKSRRNTRRHTGNEVIDVIHEEKFNENDFD